MSDLADVVKWTTWLRDKHKRSATRFWQNPDEYPPGYADREALRDEQVAHVAQMILDLVGDDPVMLESLRNVDSFYRQWEQE